VKEGAGGLRDYHAAIWAMRAVLPSARGLEDLLHYGLLTESEMEDYRDALDFLWWVRNELHLLANRRQDQMSFETQEQIAAALGYPDGGADAPLPVELFMGDYYRHARAIRSFSELAIEQCRARVRRASDRRRRHAGRFPRGGRSPEIPTRRTCASVRCDCWAFAVAQENDVALSRCGAHRAREPAPDRRRLSQLSRDDCRFLRILDSERVMRTLMTMNDRRDRALPAGVAHVRRWQHVVITPTRSTCTRSSWSRNCDACGAVNTSARCPT
jgi:UTP:GlnB (protein PII) uridylyltransferase